MDPFRKLCCLPLLSHDHWHYRTASACARTPATLFSCSIEIWSLICGLSPFSRLSIRRLSIGRLVNYWVTPTVQSLCGHYNGPVACKSQGLKIKEVSTLYTRPFVYGSSWPRPNSHCLHARFYRTKQFS